MRKHALAEAALRRGTWRWTPADEPPVITWWPASLPGSDLDDRRRRRSRRPARPRIRRGRIQFVRGWPGLTGADRG